jgi:hypothetical protein
MIIVGFSRENPVKKYTISHLFQKNKVLVGEPCIHYEKLPDCEGLPHTMMLILAKSLSGILLNDKPTNTYFEKTSDDIYYVLYSLDEIKHVVFPVELHPYPVYGNYMGIQIAPYDGVVCNLYEKVMDACDDYANGKIEKYHFEQWLDLCCDARATNLYQFAEQMNLLFDQCCSDDIREFVATRNITDCQLMVMLKKIIRSANETILEKTLKSEVYELPSVIPNEPFVFAFERMYERIEDFLPADKSMYDFLAQHREVSFCQRFVPMSARVNVALVRDAKFVRYVKERDETDVSKLTITEPYIDNDNVEYVWITSGLIVQ